MEQQLTAARAIADGYSLDGAISAWHNGEMSYREWRKYRFAWMWSAARFSGQAAAAQDAYAARHGQAHYAARLRQVARAAANVSNRLNW